MSFAGSSVVPFAGLDGSWEIGLQLAHRDSLQWGQDIVFTYGPLGYLAVPLVGFGVNSTIAFLFVAGLQFCLAAAVAAASYRTFGPVAALALSWIVATSRLTAPLVALVFLACATVLLRPRAARTLTWVAAAGGAASGIALLVKLNDGVVVSLVTMLAVVSLGRSWRVVGLYLVALVGTGLSLWALDGQHVNNVLPFLATGIDIVSGYSSIPNAINPGGPAWLVEAVLVAGVVSGLAIAATRRCMTAAMPISR